MQPARASGGPEMATGVASRLRHKSQKQTACERRTGNGNGCRVRAAAEMQCNAVINVINAHIKERQLQLPAKFQSLRINCNRLAGREIATGAASRLRDSRSVGLHQPHFKVNKFGGRILGSSRIPTTTA